MVRTISWIGLRWSGDRPRQRVVALVSVIAAAVLVAAGCGSSDGGGVNDGATDSRLRVVVTTPLLGEFAGRVAGDAAEVVTLIPRGVDLHSWQPPTSVVRRVTEADLLIVNGYRLEEGLLGIVEENARPGTPIIVAAAGLEPLAGGHEDGDEAHGDDDHGDKAGGAGLMEAEGDPHLWLAVRNAIGYVENIRDALVDADAAGAEGYRERSAVFIAELEALDTEVREMLTAIPEARRRIVAFHDAYQYLAHEYGFEISASVSPGNPNQETSARSIADIIERVRELGVGAVYRESQFSAQSLDLIAEATGVEVLLLYSTLSDAVPTYAEMMRANAASLVDGLAGNG